VEENITKMFDEGYITTFNCHKCLKGNQVQSRYEPQSDKTWFILFDVETSPHKAEEWFVSKKELNFGKNKFHLAGLVIHNSKGGKLLS